MALGKIFFSGTSLDSASDPDDTTLIAAQGARQSVYLKWVAVTVETLQASSQIVLEDGVGGAKLVVVDSTAIGTSIFEFPGDGLKLTANTLLNATVEGATGVVATASGEAVVRGG